MKILEKDSTFALTVDFTLSPTDHEVLTLLYLPIIKGESLALYDAFVSLASFAETKGFFTSDSLLSLLGYPAADLLLARSRLEGIGLLETYRKEAPDQSGSKRVSYLYHLLPPATPKKFFSDVLLKTALSSAVGGKTYFELKSHFRVTQNKADSDYVRVTDRFKDAFVLDIDPSDPSLQDDDSGLIAKRYKTPEPFDQQKLFALLRESQYPEETLTPSLDAIVSASLLYGIKEEDVAVLILKNTDSEHRFYLPSFLDDERSFTRYQAPAKENSDEAALGDSKTSARLRHLMEVTPQVLLSERLHAKPAPFMLKEIEKIKMDCSLSNSVLNVLLDYSLTQTSGEFNDRFLEKTAYTLSANGLSDAYSALVYLNNRDYEKNQSLSRKKAKKDLPEPEKDEPSEGASADLSDLGKKLGI